MLYYSRSSYAYVLVVGICMLGKVPAAIGIEFDINYVPGATNSDDPTGARLLAIVQQAAVRWTEIIEDNHVMTLDVSYYSNDGPGMDPCGEGVTTACAPLVLANAAQNRTVVGNILFFADRDWYFDPSPSDDSEFGFTQTLYLDLSQEERAAGYSGAAIEPLLEVGFRGANNGSDADVAGRADLLSTALHEIGHHVGVTNQFAAAANETADGDYDLPHFLLGDRTMAVVAAPGDEFHFVDLYPLMSDQGSLTGTRRLPTATDVLAAAAVSGWSQIDLPRQDFLTGTSWSSADNWIGKQVPGSTDAVSIRGNFNSLIGSGDVLLNQSDAVASLFVGSSSNLRINGFRLDVDQRTTITADGTLPYAQIIVESGGELEAAELLISGGELDMRGGLADIQGTATIIKNGAGGNIAGFGTVAVQNSLANDGLIYADDGTLTFTSNNSGDVFDIDGLGAGEVDASLGNIVFAANIDPFFSGEMTIGENRFVEINNPWRLTSLGELHINGGNFRSNAEVRGAALDVDGAIVVQGRGALKVPLTFGPTAAVNLSDQNSRLALGDSNDTITFNGGAFTGSGTLVQVGDVVVSTGATVQINTGAYDWDVGIGADMTATTLEPAASMIIHVNELTDPADGDVTLKSNSMLSVTTDQGSWDYGGRMTFNPSGSGTTILDGSAINVTTSGVLHFQQGTGIINPDVALLGSAVVQGIADFNGAFGFGDASAITLDGGILRFNGNSTNYGGSVITGNGAIQQNGTGFVVFDQTIGIEGIFDWDGVGNDTQFFVNPGTTFSLSANNINLGGSNQYSGDLALLAGSVIVDVASDQWTMAGTLRMNGVNGQGAGIFGDLVNITGTVETNVAEAHFFSAPSRFLPGSTTNVHTNTQLQFNAPVTFSGGQHGGAGVIGINDTATVTGGNIDIAQLQIGAAATMTVSGGSVTATSFTKESGGNLVFDGGEVTISGGEAQFNSSFSIGGPRTNRLTTFRVENGADVSVTFSWRIAPTEGHSAMTLVNGVSDGRRSTLRGTSGGAGADLLVGGAGVGGLAVLGGGLVDLRDDLIIGQHDGSHGEVGVGDVQDGFRATIDVTGGSGANIQIGGGDGGGAGTGSLSIENGGFVQTSSDVLLARFPGALGALNVRVAAQGFPAELDVADDIFVGGTGTSPGGIAFVNIDDGGLVRADEMIVWQDGTVTMEGGDLHLNRLDLEMGGGDFQLLGGTFHVNEILGDLDNPGGTISPGDSPGTMTISGNYTQAPNGTLRIQLGGTTTGDDNDQLLVNGTATLGGRLAVEFYDDGTGSFVPSDGDSFEILSAPDGGINGEFETLNLPDVAANVAHEVSYTENSVFLRYAILALLEGDYNNSGHVEQADLDLVLLNWGESATPIPAGWINNLPTGNIDQSELDGVLLHWGNISSAVSEATGPVGPVGVPEPATLPILLLFLAVRCAIRVEQYSRRQLRERR